MKTMRVTVEGNTAPGVTAKDIIMKVVQVIGAGGANGYAVEFAGSAIRGLDMAGRMTVCNMAVELGARAALIAADEVTEAAMGGHAHSGQFAFHGESWMSDTEAVFDQEVTILGAEIEPLITWGTSPDQSVPITANVPVASDYVTPKAKAALTRSLQYMGLSEGQSAQSIEIDTAFIGSCTNSRIEDLREAAKILEGRKVATGVEAIVVPGSVMTRIAAEAEGLRAIFEAAGFEWRPEAGCSMCLAMNDDIAMDGERVASSTNRNFEGRQGRGARTHLMSPAMVAAAAIAGHLVDVRDFK
jgi:3-isopropylmalate/(R)-2-methylmalate dehydratase large subunit